MAMSPKDSSVAFEKPKKVFKIIVIGDTNVGKTCLTYRFCGAKFPSNTEATVGVDFREKDIVIDNEYIKLQIWDTAGQERFRKSMVPHYYRNVHAVVFVYDMTDITTFNNLEHWIDECNRCQEGNFADIPRVIVGNKCDSLSKIAVNTRIAQKFADHYSMPLFETSAKEDSQSNHIDAIFMTIAHKLKNRKPLMLSSEQTIKVHDSKNSKSTQIDDGCWC